MAKLVGIGFEIIGILLVAVWAGGLLDQRYAAQGLWTGGLVLLGLVGWFLHLLYLLKEVRAETKDKG